MAYDKVVDSSVLNSKLTAIANAIRTKTGGTAKLTLEQMPTEVLGIESGGGDADEVINNMLARGFTEFSSDTTSIGKYAFTQCTSLKKIDFPNVTSIGEYAFAYCSALTEVNMPTVTSIGNQVFHNCSSLVSINLPNLTSMGNQAFAYCKYPNITLPKLTSIGTYAFYNTKTLRIADLVAAQTINANAFNNCNSLIAVILRSSTMCTLANTNAFTTCYHFLGTTNSTYNPSGAKDGYIYVPRTLVNTYKAAANWSTYASQFRALEDYTVDGTTTGALDESKI